MTVPYSILMSVYKADCSDYLRDALSSMLNQTVPTDDFVVVCDGPLNPALDAVLDEYARENDGVINLIRLEKNGGLGKALQEGLKHCKHEIVVRMDSDDISRPDRCELLLQKMENDDLDLVGGAIEEFDSVPGDMGSIRKPPTTHLEIVRYSRARNPFNHVSVAFKKSVVEKAGGYQHFPYLEDYHLWVRMLQQGCKCANLEDVLVDVRVGSGMYARRSNMAYLKWQKAFFDELVAMGHISGFDAAKTMAARTAATVMPSSMVKTFYTKLLRG